MPILGVVLLAVAAFAAYTLIHDLGQDENTPAEGTPASSDRELAVRYAPVLYLSGPSQRKPAEGLLPIDLPHYLRVADLKAEFRIGRPQLIPTASDLDKLREAPCRLRRRCRYFLNIRRAEPGRGEAPYIAAQRSAFEPGRVSPTVYWHVKHYRHDVAVQFWFLYLFNDFLDQHESDWEQVTVHVARNGKPHALFYSSHKLGHRMTASPTFLFRGHPLVYVAYGSHANYFVPGVHKIQLTCKRKTGEIAKRCVKFGAEGFGDDHAKGCGRALISGAEAALPSSPCREASTIVRYHLEPLRPPVFSGSYGRRNTFLYGLVPDREAFNDPRLREAWSDPLRFSAYAPAEPNPVR